MGCLAPKFYDISPVDGLGILFEMRIAFFLIHPKEMDVLVDSLCGIYVVLRYYTKSYSTKK